MAVGVSQQRNLSAQNQIFPAEYFTGSDVSVYFGDVFVDEIVQLEFSMQERILPLMGYSSYTFHKIARGARQIRGTFAINFKKVGYLHTILDHLGRIVEGENGAAPYLARILNQDAKPVPDWIARAHENIESVLDRVNKPKVLRKIPERWYIPLRQGDCAPGTEGTDKAFADKHRSIEDAKAALVRRGFLSQIDADKIAYYDATLKDAVTRFQLSSGFYGTGTVDISTSQILTDTETDRENTGLDAAGRMSELEAKIWGTSVNPDMGARYKPYFTSGENSSRLSQRGFDIYITYGSLDQVVAVGGKLPTSFSPAQTVKALYGVQITGSQQVVAADGRHVMEVYTFEARDMDINTGTPGVDKKPTKSVEAAKITPQRVVGIPPTAPTATAKTVSRVLDGDTIVLSDDTHIRIIGVNTPELAANHQDMKVDDPYAQEAFKFLKGLVEGKSVKIQIGREPTDKYGRTLAYVWTTDGKFVETELLRRGLGKVLIIPPNKDYEDALRQAEKAAQKENLGIWSTQSANAPQPPAASKSAPADTAPNAPQTLATYVVKEGDTLWGIAQKLFGNGAQWTDLYANNKHVIGGDPGLVTAGMALQIGKPSSKTYTVQDGDSLWVIAAKFYSDGSQWNKIYAANKQAIGGDPGSIRVGMELVIP